MSDRISRVERILAAICERFDLHLCKRCSDETKSVCELCKLPICPDGCCVVRYKNEKKEYWCFDCHEL